MCKQAFVELARELSSDLLHEAKEKGYTRQLLGMKIGKKEKTLHNIASDVSKSLTLAEFIGILMTIRGTETLRRLAHLIGAELVELPEADPGDPRQLAEALQEFGEFIKTHAKAIEDGVITKEEAEEIRGRGYRVIKSVLQVILPLEVER